ncbi:MAG: hypothetical protein IT518_20265 [Burkholderiales bacterium]|nr:hypothetical protein [Burkholderiales bacterium]
MKIPLGDFGNVVGEGRRGADTSAIGRAVQGLGDTGQAIAVEMQRERQRLASEEQQERRAMARAQADNAALDYELEVKRREAGAAEDLTTGDLDPDRAVRRFDDEIAQIQEPEIEHLDPIARESLGRARRRIAAAGRMKVEGVATAARRRAYQSQFATALDTLGKQAGLPGADIEAINARAEAYRDLGRQAGLPPDQLGRALQDFKDRNWLNHAQSRSMAARNSLPQLEALAKDLTAADGYYASRLDTDRRNALLRGVQADQDQLRIRIENQALRVEARAERALAAIDRQIASGVPATPQMWAAWQAQVAGSQLTGEFRQRLDDEAEIQRVLRSPVDQQLRLVQEREAKLTRDGGSIAEAANVARLRRAVDASVQKLHEAPLSFAEERLGVENQPIDLSRLLEPGGASQVAALLGERAATIDSLRKQFGGSVPLRPLLPQESQTLASTLESASPAQASQFYAALRHAAGDDTVFRGAMQQIAPDSPIKALAGVLSSKQRALTLERNWIADDVVASSRDVAVTLLQGERLLNRSEGDKTADGKAQPKLFLPETTTLQASFQAEVGRAFAGRPGAAELAFQAVQAYYVGKAAQTGRLASSNSDIDLGLVRESVRATLGTVVTYNGNDEVIAPWGMDAGEFEDRVETAIRIEAKRRNLPWQAETHSRSVGLVNGSRDGEYTVTVGRRLVLDDQGQPVTINVHSNDPGERSGAIARGSR